MSQEAVRIFYSYSHHDLDMRNRLENYLSVLRSVNQTSTWHDLELETDVESELAILDKLDTADIILLLISNSFIASQYCYSAELKRAIARHEAGTAQVIPIILRPCNWKQSSVPFSKLHVLPPYATPIISWADPDKAFRVVAQRIRETVYNQLRNGPAQQPPMMNIWRMTGGRIRVDLSSFLSEDLRSDREVDYTQLRALLKARQWKAADQETTKRMWEVMDRQEVGWLRAYDIQNFPCGDLRTIDQLWVTHSQGRFGFSVQKKIYVECGGSLDGTYPSDQIWEKFFTRVGWGWGRSWWWTMKSYDEIGFPPSASPPGQLPTTLLCEDDLTQISDECYFADYGGVMGFGGLMSEVISSLSHRLVKCRINQL